VAHCDPEPKPESLGEEEAEEEEQEEEQEKRRFCKGDYRGDATLCGVFCSPWLLLNSFEFGLSTAEVVVVSGGGGHEGAGCSSFTKREGEQMH